MLIFHLFCKPTPEKKPRKTDGLPVWLKELDLLSTPTFAEDVENIGNFCYFSQRQWVKIGLALQKPYPSPGVAIELFGYFLFSKYCFNDFCKEVRKFVISFHLPSKIKKLSSADVLLLFVNSRNKRRSLKRTTW